MWTLSRRTTQERPLTTPHGGRSHASQPERRHLVQHHLPRRVEQRQPRQHLRRVRDLTRQAERDAVTIGSSPTRSGCDGAGERREVPSWSNGLQREAQASGRLGGQRRGARTCGCRVWINGD